MQRTHHPRFTEVCHADRCLLAFTGTAICGWALSLAWLWVA
jgi:hypothetical protein